MRLRRPASALLVLLALVPAAAQQGLTLEWIYSEAGRAVSRVPEHAWLRDGSLLFHDTGRPTASRLVERITPSTGARHPAFDMAKAVASLREVVQTASSGESLGWPDAIDPSGCAFLLPARRRRVRARHDGARHTPDPQPGTRTEPDGVAGWASRRIRARAQPLHRGRGHRRGDADHDRRLRDGAERHAVLGLLGGDFRPARHGVLVVARRPGARLPAHRRVARWRPATSWTSSRRRHG